MFGVSVVVLIIFLTIINRNTSYLGIIHMNPEMHSVLLKARKKIKFISILNENFQPH